MSLNKKIILFVDGYKISLSDEINLYQNDQINLVFEINELDNNINSSNKIVPILPLDANLYIETPVGIEAIESANVYGNIVSFFLSKKYTQHIGVSLMQIQLLDSNGSQLTLPSFSFEVKKNIYDGEYSVSDVLLSDENGNVISDENNNSLVVGTQIQASTYSVVTENSSSSVISTKQIKDFDLKEYISGTEDILIQDNGVTKRIKASELKDNIDLSNYATKDDLNTKADITAIPTKVSALANDSGFISSIPSEYITETELTDKNYATQSFVTNKIAEASLSGGNVNLSNYATKDDLNTKADSNHTHTASDINGLNIPDEYVLPVATTDTLGGIKIGNGLSIADGILSVDNTTDSNVPNTIINQNGNTPFKIWAGTALEYENLLIKENDVIYLVEEQIYVTYSITNNLTNCTSSNKSSIIKENSSYKATLIADNGYKLDTVAIRMGETDITSSAYSNGVISISSVTGNIVITVNAIRDNSSSPGASYSLVTDTIFDGSISVDTGIALFDRDKDWTIYAEFTNGVTSSFGSYGFGTANEKQMTLFRCKQTTSPWIGMDIALHSQNYDMLKGSSQSRGELIGSDRRGWYLGKMSSGVGMEYADKLKFAIKRVSSERKMYFYDSQGLIGSYNDPGTVADNTFNTKVILGGEDSSTSLCFKGTVHKFMIWEENKTEEEILSLFNK